MAKANKVQVLEKNTGTKIDWQQSGDKLIFGDDDLSIRCGTRQRDYPVHVDICADDDGNLVIGVGAGRYYVAQVDIPPITYTETEVETAALAGGEPEGAAIEGAGYGMPNIIREPQPINMADVMLTLWSLDDLRSNQ
jgi:hypothetical protein